MKNGDTVYVVGKLIGGGRWELGGVFLTRDEAWAACLGRDYFIGEAIVGQSWPYDTVPWPVRYPYHEHWGQSGAWVVP